MLDGTRVAPDPLTPRSMCTRRIALFAVVCSTVVLAACAGRTTRAPVSDQSRVQSGVSSAASGTYVVRPGDTLYQVAQAHGMDASRLAQLNNITDPTQLAIGQVLRLDEKTPLPGRSARSGTGSSSAPAAPAGATTTGSSQTKPAGSTATPPRASDASQIAWAWPASGKIIQGFNSTTKGIDIEGEVGSPVQAAAAGKVLYAGNGVRGLGNLVLLGHGNDAGQSNGFITAYAHNQTLLVKTGQTVKRGEKIATLGQSDASSPRLHFEIRRRGTPVNPLSYLPAR